MTDAFDKMVRANLSGPKSAFSECKGEHRPPQGPNEDIGVCPTCWFPTFAMRPTNETFGFHTDDCSLPADHPSYCAGGGDGHPPAEVIRG